VSIVGAFDVHRSQITYKLVELETGEVWRGRVAPATRESLRAWLSDRFELVGGEVAVEATTGWRFVCEELAAVGVRARLADPAETAASRGRKRRAKTDRADCDLLLRLLVEGRLPEAWIPPAQLLELRTRVRLRKALVDEQRAWRQRLQAQLFQQGVRRGIAVLSSAGRAELAGTPLSPAGAALVGCGLAMIDQLQRQLAPLDAELRQLARSQPGARMLMGSLYGVGPIVATAILAELGDCRRFSSSDDAVRHAGLDISVYASDQKRSPGHLVRQGPELLRWALYEAAQSAAKPASPDHAYYLQVRARHDHQRACLSVARKLCRRSYHLLRELGEQAIAPAAIDIDEAALAA
jgi:transposase